MPRGARVSDAGRPGERPGPVLFGAGAYVVGRLGEQDLDAVARAHVAGFGDSFLATLGVPFLRRYYRTFLDYREGCGLVAPHQDSGPVVGFGCGTENLRRHYRVFLRRRLPPAAPALIARAVQKPGTVVQLLRRLRPLGRIAGARGRPTPAAGPAAALPPAHLMSVAVLPEHRRHGVGELLVRAFVEEMTRRGVPQLVLGVRDDNLSARRLYERLGWRPAHVERALDGAPSWLYVRNLREWDQAVRERG